MSVRSSDRMSATDLLGWDLLYNIVGKDFKKEADVLVALMHWFLIRNSFKCIGLGDNVSMELMISWHCENE